jgi:hypothetical protein
VDEFCESGTAVMILFLILFLASHCLAAKFKTAGLKRIDLGLDSIPQGRIAAFCDFNSDKLVGFGFSQSRLT